MAKLTNQSAALMLIIVQRRIKIYVSSRCTVFGFERNYSA
jgi:hypothetical protein